MCIAGLKQGMHFNGQQRNRDHPTNTDRTVEGILIDISLKEKAAIANLGNESQLIFLSTNPLYLLFGVPVCLKRYEDNYGQSFSLST